MGLITRIFTCIFFVTGLMYFYLREHNNIVELQMKIPTLKKELQEIESDNIRLSYELEQLEDPLYLMKLLQRPEYSHLKFPYNEDVIIIREGSLE